MRSAADAAGAQASITLSAAIEQLVLRGMKPQEIKEALWDSLMHGQGAFAALHAIISRAAVGVASRHVAVKTAVELSEDNPAREGVWIGTGSNVMCEDCIKLHGQHMTMREFQILHGTNRCGANCQCFWAPWDEARTRPISLAAVKREHPEYWEHSLPDYTGLPRAPRKRAAKEAVS